MEDDRQKTLDARVSTAVDDVKDAQIVIMNPPFTNRAKMGEKFSTQDQKALRLRSDALQEMVEKNDLAAGNFMDKNSIEPLFTFLADKCLRDNGILASVVPTISLCATSATRKRRFLASRYHIHTILTCHQPNQMNMSQNSASNESLIVARKWSKHEREKPPTRFVSLDRFPMNEEAAIELCGKLSRHAELDKEWGTVSGWPASRIATGDWSPGIWRDPVLAEASYQFSKNKEFVPLGSLSGVRVYATGQILRENFESSTEETPGSFPIAKKAGADGQQFLRSRPDEYWIAKKTCADGLEATQKLLNKSAHLLVSTKQRLSTARLCAVVGQKLVGNAWVPVVGLPLEEAQAIGVFLNSTIGRLVMLRSRGNLIDFPSFSAEEQSKLPIPHVTENSRIRRVLAQCYQQTCDKLVPQFRDGECNIRIAWDRAVENAVGLASGSLDDLRHRLDKEPCVRGIGYTDGTEAADEDYEEDEFEA